MLMAGGLLAAGAFSLRGSLSPAGGLLFTIPAGASQTVARPGFDSAIPIPTDIRFASPAEAVITVNNLDDVEHRAGPFLVGAGQTFVQRFPEPGRYSLVCTVDPLETVVVAVGAQGAVPAADAGAAGVAWKRAGAKTASDASATGVPARGRCVSLAPAPGDARISPLVPPNRVRPTGAGGRTSPA
jgi:hypothetical protein